MYRGIHKRQINILFHNSVLLDIRVLFHNYNYCLVSVSVTELPTCKKHCRCVATSAVLRLECLNDCISGSVGHQQNIFRSFPHCQHFF